MKLMKCFSYKKLLTGLFAIGYGSLFITPNSAFAHVKWFAEAETPIRNYQFTDTPVIIGIIATVVLFFIAVYLEETLIPGKKVHQLVQNLAPKALSLASIGFGLAFIIFTLNGFIFAPNLPALGTWGTAMLVLQGLIGVMMFIGLYERIGAFLLFILFIMGVSHWGIVEMLDTLEMLGFAAYIFLIGRPLWKVHESTHLQNLTHRFRNWGYPLLRLGVGINLILLAFSEKLLSPSLTHNFLQNFNWNIASPYLTDYWFAFYAGVAELFIGLLFVFGLVTRTTTMILAGLLITTLMLLGLTELVGHLPHFSLAIVLLVLGSGSHFVLEHTEK